MLFYAFLLAAPICLSWAQELLSVLAQQSELSHFASYLQQYPDVVEQLNGGQFTVLAPSNTAIETFEQSSNLTSDEWSLLALLQYHIIRDVHPSATFEAAPFTPATLLTNTTYANVTGGQRVKCTSVDGRPAVLSGVQAVSRIVHADVLFLGGLIQIIDAVLTIPLTGPATWTKAGLNDMIALLNKGGWLSDPAVAETALYSTDLTSLLPNSPLYGASYTGFEGLSEVDLQSLYQYCILPGQVLYSTDLKNSSKFKTPQGDSITVTRLNDELYIDTSKIIMRDFLTTNGVLQVLDSPLNPNTTNKRPTVSPSPTPKPSNSGGLSPGAKAGIAIAVVAVVGGVVFAWFWVRRRRREGISRKSSHGSELDSKTWQRVDELYGKGSRAEAVELGPPLQPAELGTPVDPVELGWN